jgi:hypothetical protein
MSKGKRRRYLLEFKEEAVGLEIRHCTRICEQSWRE